MTDSAFNSRVSLSVVRDDCRGFTHAFATSWIRSDVPVQLRTRAHYFHFAEIADIIG